jgi:non-ribosomal peptide synthase protein (TIGR01720 family)
MVMEGELRINWTYSTRLHRRTTIDALASGFISELRAVVELCLKPGAGGCTPSDFPLAALDDGKLDRIANMLARSKKGASGKRAGVSR